MQRLLIIGATGLIGKHIINAIVASKTNFESIRIFTSAVTADSKPGVMQKLKSEGVEIFIGDLKSDEDFKRAIEGKLCYF